MFLQFYVWSENALGGKEASLGGKNKKQKGKKILCGTTFHDQENVLLLFSLLVFCFEVALGKLYL